MKNHVSAAMHTRSHRLSLDFQPTTSNYHYPTPSHSPALTSRPFSPALHSSLDTPLASYATQRRRYMAQLQPEDDRNTVQVPLSVLSPPSVYLGAVGGHFNSTTKVKFLPLPTLYTPHQVSHRGIRSVRLHADRYVPSERQGRGCSTISDSFLNLPSLDNRPKARLIDHEGTLKSTRQFKSNSGILPHRIEQPFYMTGHSAQITETQQSPFNGGDIEEMRRVQFNENPSLFYGRGLTDLASSRSRGKSSGAVHRFEVRLRTALEDSRNHGDIEVDDVGRFSRVTSRGITPAPTILEEDPSVEKTHHDQKQTFATQSKHNT